MTTYLVAIHLLLEIGPEPRPAINAALNEILSEAMRQNNGGRSALVDWAVAGEDLAASIASVDVSPAYEPDVTPFPGMARGTITRVASNAEPAMTALDEHDLSRMEASSRRTRGQLDLLERQICERAEQKTVSIRTKSRSFRRQRSRWSMEDERMFRRQVEALAFERRGELDSLRERLANEEKAIAGLRARRSPVDRIVSLPIMDIAGEARQNSKSLMISPTFKKVVRSGGASDRIKRIELGVRHERAGGIGHGP